jgi:hypothetical protein
MFRCVVSTRIRWRVGLRGQLYGHRNRAQVQVRRAAISSASTSHIQLQLQHLNRSRHSSPIETQPLLVYLSCGSHGSPVCLKHVNRINGLETTCPRTPLLFHRGTRSEPCAAWPFPPPRSSSAQSVAHVALQLSTMKLQGESGWPSRSLQRKRPSIPCPMARVERT